MLTVDVENATLNLARSKDGLTNWEVNVENSNIGPKPEPDCVYKPFTLYDEAIVQWLMWYNGRCGVLERVGMSSLKGNFGRFVERAGPPQV